MTLLPHDNRNVKGIPYDIEHPKYKVGPLCCVPGCSRIADHAHHIWRRSFLTGDYGWVRLWDDIVLQNLCGICYMHHNLVTENKASITWSGENFLWNGDGQLGALLEPQPQKRGMYLAPVIDLPTPAHDTEAPGHVEKCPTCKRALAKKATKTEGKRERGKWAVTIPKDSIENGADVLDTLIEEAAKICGHDEQNDKTKYHTLAFALGMFVLHSEELMNDA
jgi:hypothetical protein